MWVGFLNTLCPKELLILFRISYDEHLEEDKLCLIEVFETNGCKKKYFLKELQKSYKQHRTKEGSEDVPNAFPLYVH